LAINLNLELTDHCNIKCKMCSQSLRDDAHGAPHRFMAWETWRAMLAGLEGMQDEIHLCPHWLGEPTLHPRFDDFVEYAFAINRDRRLFHEFKLHTNAVIFSEDRARRMVRLANAPSTHPSCFRFVHFSIDAFSAPVYREVKGADRREMVFRNVERFLRVRSELGGERPYAHIAFVVQPDNAHEARAFRDHWGGILDELGRAWESTWDWPCQDRDALYFRPLNCGDQRASDRLHARTVADLGLVPPELADQRLRAAQSF
jgi:MoaA/NifB/PqqE/SkfB family radical SAM enzyme